MTYLRLHMTAAPIHTLGPYARFGLWVQGCRRNCPGCATPDARPQEGGYTMEVEALTRRILNQPGIEGLTISGGEPFLQAEALCLLIRQVQSLAPLGVILYTGYTYEEIRDQPLTGLCDAIIDGPYVAEQDDGGRLRGSSNQRLILRTPRYQGLLGFGGPARRTELVRSFEGGLALVGVPSQGDLEWARTMRARFCGRKRNDA